MAIVPDELVRSKRKTLSVCVDGQGRLIVRAPARCSQARIDAFLCEKEKWIIQKQAERRAVAIPPPKEDGLDGYALPLLGERITVRLASEKRVRYLAEEKLLYLPSDEPKARLVKWLKDNAKRISGKVTDEYAAKMGVSYLSIAITSARTRWGSCSAKNALRYTFRLLHCPRELIEYVVIHELAHIRHKNHSEAFWQEVERACPDWKTRRRQLKDYGSVMNIL